MEKEITSVNNELVKQVVKLHQKKYRDEEKKFLLEGFKVIEEAFKSGIEIEKVFVSKENAKYNFLQDKLILTTEAVLKKISTTETPPEAVAVAKQKKFTLADINQAKKVILLENIKDLGNLGTILRTAKAFSQDAIILFGETVDLYNPKCVRSSVGNLWKIPVVQIKDFKTLETEFAHFERVATLPKSNHTVNLKDFQAKLPYLIMFGSEAEGLSPQLTDFSTQKVTIEMNSEVESLNLSVSVGIILNAVNRK
ncbi:MAG: RNA methyltransferase [Candidatus Gastranaerophilales bacterium]|nr:RNA methyltransferase [Candidatus Gastranaerophilales bacterium]